MYIPRALALATAEHTEVDSVIEKGMHEVKKDTKKKEQPPYPAAMSTVSLPLSTV